MTETAQISASAHDAQDSPAAAETQTQAAEQGLVPVAGSAGKPEDEIPEVAGAVALLPIELDVSVPVRNFRVHDLLTLDPGQLIETQWHSGDDVPLAAGDVQLAWSEFEVIESDLAVRITRLA